MAQYFVCYKPFGVVSQFSGEGETLSKHFDFPPMVYPVGRLDKDSEGLLIITDDKNLHHKLTDPKFGHKRTYFVQVEGTPDKKAIQQLCNGVKISLPDKSSYLTKKASAEILTVDPELPERNPPIRFRKNVADTWISITLSEGKNRQVRKMTAAVGHPTLRLVRKSIENLHLDGLQPGDVKEYQQKEIYQLLKLT